MSAEHEPALEGALAAYLLAAESGDPGPIDRWCERYPRHADALRELAALRADLGRFAPAADAPAVTRVGPYLLVAPLGTGGMGAVYEAVQPGTGRRVALKVLRGGPFATRTERERFRREAELTARLDHPNVVPVYEVGEADGTPYFTMKLLGETLAVRQQDLEADPARAARVVAALARGSHHAHARGVLHRDIKPGNVLFDASGVPHLTDFGLAWTVDAEHLTRTGEFVGSVGYLSPEQARGEPATTATDVHGLGAVLYFALTGRPPYPGPVAESLDRLRNRPPDPLRALNPLVPRDLEAVCRKALAKNPADRYASAAELAADLDNFVAGRPVRARPVPLPVRLWRWVLRNPRTATAAAVAVGCAVAAAGFAQSRWLREVELRASLRAEAAERSAAETRARAAEFASLLERVRTRRAERAPNWPALNCADLRRLAALPGAEESAAALRTEAVAALGGTDLGAGRAVAVGFKGYAPAFAPDGRALAIGAWLPEPDGRCAVRLLDPATGAELRRLWYPADRDWEGRYGAANTDGCRALAFAPDGAWLVVGTRSGWLVRWDLRAADPAPVRWRHAPPSTGGREPARRERVDQLAFRASGALCSGDGWQIAEWDPARGWAEAARHNPQQRIELPRPAGPALPAHLALPTACRWRAALAPDGYLVATWDEGVNNRLALTDLRSFFPRPSARLTAPNEDRADDGMLTDLAFSPDGALLATTSEHAGHLKLWEVASGRLLAGRVLAPGSLRCAWSPGGALAVCEEGQTRVFDVRRPAISDALALQTGPIHEADAAPDARAVATVAWFGPDAEVAVWDATAPRAAPRLRFQHLRNRRGDQLALEPDARAVVTATRTELTRWVLGDGSGAPRAGWEVPAARAERLGPAAEPFALARAANGTLWALEGEQLRAWHGDGRTSAVAVGPLARCLATAGDRVAVGADDGAVTWYTAAGARERFERVSAAAVTALAGEPNRAVIGTATGDAIVWAAGRALAHRPDAHADVVEAVALGPRGWFATGSRDRTVRVWGPDGQPVLALPLARPVRRVFWSADGSTLLALAEGERALRRWDVPKLRAALADLGLSPELP